MAPGKVKTAFCLSSGLNEDYTGIQQGSTTNNNNIKKYQLTTTKYQPNQSEGVLKQTQKNTYTEISL